MMQKSAYIVSVFVHPFFARQGVGKAMVDHVEAQALKEAYKTMLVRANKNAATFFQDCGYEMLGHDTDNVGNGIALPIEIMQKQTELASNKNRHTMQKERSGKGQRKEKTQLHEHLEADNANRQ